MAEIEYGGIKLGGSKLLLIIPLVTTLGGGLWAGFEFYKDYTDMKEQIQSYVAPDLSEFDKNLAVLHEDMKIVKETVGVFKEEILIIRERLNRLMAEHTGQPLEVIERDTERDRFMDADQSQAYGLVDHVVNNREVVAEDA